MQLNTVCGHQLSGGMHSFHTYSDGDSICKTSHLPTRLHGVQTQYHNINLKLSQDHSHEINKLKYLHHLPQSVTIYSFYIWQIIKKQISME